MSKYVYNAIGGLSLSLGIVGVFLPLLPTTCFVLLASWAFAKSSPNFHNWLVYRSPFSKSIQNWNKFGIIPTHVKAIAASSMLISFLITALLLENIYVLTGLGLGLLALLAFIFSKPSKIEPSICQQLPEWHQPAN
ncbi:MAG: YbaN family protein [Pseudomonadota bacterium]